jgi:hypothetical protein
MNPMNRRWVMVLAMAGTLFFPPFAGSHPAEGEVLVGVLSRETVDSLVAVWPEAGAGDDRWKEVVVKLRQIDPGARVEVFLGSWCDDSQHEIPRLMKILEGLEGREPFTVRFVGVDRAKHEPAEEVEARQVRFLPTIVVSRGGQEVGRIVQRPARTLETDLLRLLDGSARGLLSSNEEVILQYLQESRASMTRPASLRTPR